MTELYQEKLQAATIRYRQLNKQYNQLAFVRFLTIMLAISPLYKAFKEGSWLMGATSVAFFIIFLLLIVKHKKIALQRTIAQTKMRINEQEIAFLEQQIYPADNGSIFQPENHPYAYDLDVLGEHSVYHYLNRTHTFLGRKLLAEKLLNHTAQQIKHTQTQIKALTPEIAWRQTFMAYAQQIDDSKDFYTTLQQWATTAVKPLSKGVVWWLVASPILLIASLIIGYGWGNEVMKSIANLLISANLITFFFFIGKISKEKLGFERTYNMLYAFKECITQVETHFKKPQASAKIAQLSRLLDELDNVSNILVSIPLNLFTFYHVHQYRQLLQWKAQYAAHIEEWLMLVAETEVLCSFANFSYNNPNFVFPTLNNEYKIAFEEVGHPLIPSKQRITNSITLNEEGFVLLTGSNMSGKSTFLRTIGVNMLLTLVGLPVCAKKATVHPLRLLVSMRLSDSLSDGKSYFFAEINRIQQIIHTLEQERCLVLLDEVLRGTNSDDKRQGTIKIIERLLSLGALGVLATHDIEVCLLTDNYPKQLKNKCFESEIKDGELTFDYKLREGVCKNKNATFLMKKLGIINS
jgi:DNA mismatch repair protein